MEICFDEHHLSALRYSHPIPVETRRGVGKEARMDLSAPQQQRPGLDRLGNLSLKREMAEPKSPLPLVCEQMEPVSADWQIEGPLTGK